MRMLGKKIECGVGGRNCSCCYPPPGKARKQDKRREKRREKREWKRDAT